MHGDAVDSSAAGVCGVSSGGSQAPGQPEPAGFPQGVIVTARPGAAGTDGASFGTDWWGYDVFLMRCGVHRRGGSLGVGRLYAAEDAGVLVGVNACPSRPPQVPCLRVRGRRLSQAPCGWGVCWRGHSRSHDRSCS